MTGRPSDRVALEVEELRKIVAEQQRQLAATRAEYDRVCKALEQRGVKVEALPEKRPPA